MSAINTLVEQRSALRRKADQLDRQSEATAVKGDELHADAANFAALALEQREEIKKYDVAIGALGGEPKKRRLAVGR